MLTPSLTNSPDTQTRDTQAGDVRASSPMVRVGRQMDLEPIVRVHAAAFPGFFLTRLGPSFLRAYYGLILQFDQGILLVVDDQGELCGFAAGFLDPSRFYRTMSAHRWRFAWPVLRGWIARPGMFARIIGNIRGLRSRQKGSESPIPASCCELSSIGVLPERSGNSLGKKLALAFMDTAKAMGATAIRLRTDAENNASVNAFYQRLGFRVERTVTTTGQRLMNEHVLALEPVPSASGLDPVRPAAGEDRIPRKPR
jgi:ribosomal protein S18 acetylase RimI-like enzyme